MAKVWSEWFWSKASAEGAGRRVEREGYVTKVRFAMAADGRHDWLLEVFDGGASA